MGASLLLGLAGCSSSTSSSGSSAPPETVENVETDPEHYSLRGDRDEPPAWIRPEESSGGGSSADDERRHLPDHGLVATAERAERVAFADVEGAADARSFVEGTDFDRETLLLQPERVGECFELDLCYVTWSATEYHTYYARLYRDVEVACEADARVWVATLVRIPDTLDPDEVTGSGSGTASGTCAPWQRRLERRRSEANASGGE